MRPTSVRKLILPVKPPMKPKRKSRKTMPNSGVKPWVLGPLLMETNNCSLAEPCIRNCGLLKTVSIFITGNPLPTICWLWIQPSMPWVWKKSRTTAGISLMCPICTSISKPIQRRRCNKAVDTRIQSPDPRQRCDSYSRQFRLSRHKIFRHGV